jgi:flagellar basal-body rod protein FlgC
MDYRTAFEISAAGMAVEKLRVDVTAMNLANMHTTARAEAGLYQPLAVVSQRSSVDFGRLLDGERAEAASLGLPMAHVEPLAASPRFVHEPGHPHADDKGMVAYPGVNHTTEMVQLVTALRAYEANVAAATVTRALATRALEIGGNS